VNKGETGKEGKAFQISSWSSFLDSTYMH